MPISKHQFLFILAQSHHRSWDDILGLGSALHDFLKPELQHGTPDLLGDDAFAGLRKET
jgi:hypothetical protein